MKQKSYSASVVKFSFWFPEFRKIIGLFAEGKSQDEIKRLCLKENALGTSSVVRANRIFLTVTARIRELDSSIHSLFTTSDLATQKLIDLTAIMSSDLLFFEFMYEVFKEKILIGAEELPDLDYRFFFRNKQLQNEKAAAWSASGIVSLLMRSLELTSRTRMASRS